MTQRSRWIIRCLPGIAVGSIAIIFVSLWLQSTSIDTNIASIKDGSGAERVVKKTSRFAGSESCKECHAQESDAWKSHPMSFSTRLVSDRVEDEDFSVAEFSPTEHIKYQVERRENGLFHHEIMIDSTGETIYDHVEQVQVVVGSGQQGHAYLIQRPGMLFASPVNWYATTGTWGLAPGYDPRAHNRFERRVTDTCIHCHAGRTAEDPSAADRFRDPVFEETGIGCERCHGPAEHHVAFHRNTGTLDSIINPSKLSHSQRDAVCNQCHLQGVERVLRAGKSEFDFRPGMHLSDIWTIFVNDTQSSTNQPKAVSHVEQMQSSQCYVQSEGSMGCTSCHDSHVGDHGQQSWQHYRSSCLKCHAAESCREDQPLRSDRNDSCIDCHMPANAAGDVPHAVHTDHRIQRRRSNASESSNGIASARMSTFTEAGAFPLPAVEADRARGIAMAKILERGESGKAISTSVAETLLRRARKDYPEDPVVLEYLGVSLDLQGRTSEADIIWKYGLKADPASESLLYRLAKLNHDSGNLTEAARYFEEFLTLNPWHAGIHGRYAHVLGLQGRTLDGIRAAEKAIELDPSLIQVRGWLIEAYRSTGQTELCDKQQQIYDRMLPITGLPAEQPREK